MFLTPLTRTLQPRYLDRSQPGSREVWPFLLPPWPVLNYIASRWIGSFQLFLAFALSLVAGKVADAGYFHPVVLSGSLLFSIWYCILVNGKPCLVCLVDKLTVSFCYLSSVKNNTVLLVHTIYSPFISD